MKGILRKMASVILIMAMVITSVSLDGLQVSAATKKPTNITLNAKSKTLTVGKSFQLKVKSVKPTKASKAVTYKSSNKKVATVSSKGKIVAKKAGKTTITVTSKSNKKVKATCKITVKKKVTPTKKPTATVAPTATPEPTATVAPTATPEPTATIAPTATPKPTMAPGDSYGELNSPIVDEEGNVTYSCIYFGNYPQSDITGETKEPIKWRVLYIKGDDAFLVADQNLDVMQYNKTYKKVTWETCAMRSWLNGYGSSSNGDGIDYSSDNFIDRAFSDTEQAAILTTNVVNDDNPEYGTEGGNNTQDKIFLLSIDEVSNSVYGFLPYADDSNFDVYDKARQRTNTAYVNNGGIIQSGWMKDNAEDYVKKYGGYYWWLRSPGYYSGGAAFVDDCDGVYRFGASVTYNDYAVCPALHINLSSSSTWSMAESVTVQR